MPAPMTVAGPRGWLGRLRRGADPLTAALGANTPVFANVAIKGGGAGLAIAAQFLLVRILGPAGYGDYAVFIASATLLLAISRLGLDVIAVRRTSILYARRLRAELASFLRDAAVLACLGTAVACAILLAFRALFPQQAFAPGLPLMVGAVLLMTMLAVFASALRGMEQLLLADGLDSVAKPILLIGMAFPAALVLPSGRVGPAAFVLAHMAVCLMVAAAIRRRLKALPENGPAAPAADEAMSPSEIGALTAIALLSYSYFSLDTLLVAHHVSAEHTGAYAAAGTLVRAVLIIPFILALRMQPRVAVCFDRGDLPGLYRTTRVALLASLGAALVAALVLAASGNWLLARMDPGFVVAYPSLLVLCVAHLVNAAVMTVSMALAMCRQQHRVFWSSVAGVLVCIPLYYVLIPWLHLMGAALSVLAGLFVNLLTLLLMARHWMRANRRAAPAPTQAGAPLAG